MSWVWAPWILLELRVMKVVVTTGDIRRANRHHEQTNTQFLSPNQQCQSTKGKTYPNHNCNSREGGQRNDIPRLLPMRLRWVAVPRRYFGVILIRSVLRVTFSAVACAAVITGSVVFSGREATPLQKRKPSMPPANTNESIRMFY